MADIPQPDGPDINIGSQYLEISWTLYSVALIVVALRLYAQGRIIGQLGWSDGLIVVSLFFGILSTFFLTFAYQFGFGRHYYYLDPSQRINAQRAIYIYEPLSILGSAIGRFSFMVLMYRLFGTSQWRRVSIIFLMVETVVINLFTAITIFTQCQNVRTLWDPIGSPSQCWSPTVQEYIGFFQSACNSATDLVLTLMPAWVFYTLHLGWKTKVGLICLMGLSVFAFIASVIKAVLLGSLAERQDYTFNTVSFFTWISVENSLVIIAASIPLVRPIFTKTHFAHPTAYELTSPTGPADGAPVYIRRAGHRHLSSEEHILPSPKEMAMGAAADAHSLARGGGIVKTTDYVVTYEMEEGSNGSGSDGDTKAMGVRRPRRAHIGHMGRPAGDVEQGGRAV